MKQPTLQAAESRHARLPSARALARFLAEAQATVRLRGQVTVLLTTDAALRGLNKRFRGQNKPTDVLSFPTEPLQGVKPAERIAGDLAISVPIARRQAAEQGHPLAAEIKVLILHGLLHLAGYDHETDAGQMARRERLLRARLGLPQGLIERVSTPVSTHVLAAEKSRKRGTRRVESRAGKNRDTDAPGPILSPASGRKDGKRRIPTRASFARSRQR